MQTTESRPQFYIMVTTKGSASYTPHALASFFAHTKLGPSDRFFLIDNDRNFDRKPLASYPRIELIENEKPLGFAQNMNFGFEKALSQKADLFLLNNDLIFTHNWSTKLSLDDGCISSPLSNREVQYASSVHVIKTNHVSNLFVCSMVMQLEDYLANKAAFASIVEAHQKQSEGQIPVYVLPFFCTKIPFPILEKLGFLDPSFGNGGGEDYDYCLRAYLAGFQVRFCLGSYLLHFYGKSSWDGVEPDPEKAARVALLKAVFKAKWGEDLFELTLHEQIAIAENEKKAAGSPNMSLNEMVTRLLRGKSVALFCERNLS